MHTRNFITVWTGVVVLSWMFIAGQLSCLAPCSDQDGDGYGNPASGSCVFPALDCNDTDPNRNPGQTEEQFGDAICEDGIDNDCDGVADGDDWGCFPCEGVEDCDDGNACTDDNCVDSRCENINNSDPCDDGNTCTGNDVCSGGDCAGAPLDDDNDGYISDACGGDDCDDGSATTNPGVIEAPYDQPICIDGADNDCDDLTDVADNGCQACNGAEDCDDGNPCTDDDCVDFLCIYLYNSGPCSDGDPCTMNDLCSDGACQDGTESCCGDGIDNDSDGGIDCVDTDCEGEVCSDGDPCTENELCSGGSCQPGVEGCCGDGVDNDNDTNIDCLDSDCEGDSCDDGDACTANDACGAGSCLAGAEICCDDGLNNDGDSGADCQDTDCDGASCDDGDECTTNDICSSMNCAGTTFPLDEDGDSYVSDACGGDDCNDSDVSVNPGIAERAWGDLMCSDTVDNDCDGSTDDLDPGCAACTVDADCDDGNPCTDDTCLGSDCVYDNNIVACDDGNICTSNDLCSGGICAGTPFALDGDGDTYVSDACGGDDCNDGDSGINPGVVEEAYGDPICEDGSDNDCDGLTDFADAGCLWLSNSALPDSGIIECFNNSQQIVCPAEGQAFFGQDAQVSLNPMSLADNQDGTVTDNVTGLMWQQDDDNEWRIWNEAIQYCTDLSLGGYTDWRLPDEFELQGIVDYGFSSPAINLSVFPGTDSAVYSTSTSDASHSELSWYVYFDTGYSSSHSKLGYGHLTRCVRGGVNPPSFTDTGVGTIIDNTTSLMWQQQDDDTARNWSAGLAYCDNLDLGGYQDWRLPDVKELRSVVDSTRYLPSIDQAYLPGTNSSEYWSSSTYEISADRAWYVMFSTGGVYNAEKTNTAFVRCVR